MTTIAIIVFVAALCAGCFCFGAAWQIGRRP